MKAAVFKAVGFDDLPQAYESLKTSDNAMQGDAAAGLGHVARFETAASRPPRREAVLKCRTPSA